MHNTRQGAKYTTCMHVIAFIFGMTFLSSLPARKFVAQAQSEEGSVMMSDVVPAVTVSSFLNGKELTNRRRRTQEVIVKGTEDSNVKEDIEERLLRRSQGNGKHTGKKARTRYQGARTENQKQNQKNVGNKGGGRTAKKKRGDDDDWGATKGHHHNRHKQGGNHKKNKKRSRVSKRNTNKRLTVNRKHNDATKRQHNHLKGGNNNKNLKKGRPANNNERDGDDDGWNKRSNSKNNSGWHGSSNNNKNNGGGGGGGDGGRLNYNYCGRDFADANSKCNVSCRDGTDGECPMGETCFADAEACPPAVPEGGGQSPPGNVGDGGIGPRNFLYCGVTFEDANSRCATPCPLDNDIVECPDGEFCWNDVIGCPPSNNAPGEGQGGGGSSLAISGGNASIDNGGGKYGDSHNNNWYKSSNKWNEWGDPAWSGRSKSTKGDSKSSKRSKRSKSSELWGGGGSWHTPPNWVRAKSGKAGGGKSDKAGKVGKAVNHDRWRHIHPLPTPNPNTKAPTSSPTSGDSTPFPTEPREIGSPTAGDTPPTPFPSQP